MLLKILLTALVILGAVLVLRRRALRVQQTAPAVQPAVKKSRLAYVDCLWPGFGDAGGYCFFSSTWSGLTVIRLLKCRLLIPGRGKSVSYKAHRGEMEGRSFRTLDGADSNPSGGGAHGAGWGIE